MDTYLLKAAVLYALSATQQTTTLVDEFLQNTSFANSDLDPLAYELLDLRTPLERLGDSEIVIPTRLQPPILAIVRGSGDALARVDAVLHECADGPLREALWVTKVPEVRDLKNGLQTCRRALQVRTTRFPDQVHDGLLTGSVARLRGREPVSAGSWTVNTGRSPR